MIKVSPHWRQLDILNPETIHDSITLIGAGGVGSPTALALIKMGVPDLTIYDPDIIEKHNIPNQLYSIESIGKYKVEALYEELKRHMTESQKIIMKKRKWSPMEDMGIIISAVDSMDSRIEIWEEVKKSTSPLYIDSRMGGELMRLYTVDLMGDMSFYEKTLYSSKEADDIPCTARSIIYNVFILAGLIASQVKKYFQKELYKKEIIYDIKSNIYLQS